MGSASSKFRKYLQNGDEVAALHLYNNNSDLRKALDPSSSYGDSHQNETPLHYAARHGMKSLLRIFLSEHDGNPNKTNSRKETALHCVCMEKNSQFYTVKRRRAECLNMVLHWRGATLTDGEVEKVDLASVDEEGNTALHHSAASGLMICVERLVAAGAPLFSENTANQTPCDSAEKSGHGDIALYLESKMVFSNVDEDPTEEIEELPGPPYSEDYSGLRAQDLQEAKDQLLVETADMLSVPLFTAEALLRNHEWSRETLLESWMTDPFACCDKCGVTPPPSLYADTDNPMTASCTSAGAISEVLCDICANPFPSAEEPVEVSCEHVFCRPCWKYYLNLKIQEGDAHHITCPAFDCTRLVAVDIIESIVSREMARKYLQFDIQAFVESNPTIKWCPHPGCGNAVKLPDTEGSSSPTAATFPKLPSDTSRAVDCGNGHYFCWDCLGEAHEPCGCDNWKKWHEKVAEIKPEQLNSTEGESESAANCLWLVTNSKHCPNCKSPIQKNEGCNHMKCSKCKHDFCWVCLEPWKRHNSATGGYFKCNRYEAVRKVDQASSEALADAEQHNSQMQELNRFVHYYTRFRNHENSYKLEEPLVSTAKDKMMKLAEAVTDPATANEETKFVEEAVHQLLKARRVLKCSYVYGFYLDGPGYKKIVFEFMQTELEECTEILSQMVNRLYLRTPRKKIIDQATLVQRKRYEFISAIAKGLVPPETPPSLRKHKRRKYSMDLEDEELRKAILASIQEVNPANPWIKDASGRHTNVMAVLDWPGYESDESDNDASQQTAAKETVTETCMHAGCTRPRAQNPRTNTIHDHCSLRCLRLDQLEKMDEQVENTEVFLDEHMDLLRALEMSRLQFLRDSGLIHTDAKHVSDVDSFLSSPGKYWQSWMEIGRDLGAFLGQPGSSTTTDTSDPPPPDTPPTDTASTSDTERLTPMERLDKELQNVLKISSLNPTGEIDPDLKLAMQISLHESTEPPPDHSDDPDAITSPDEITPHHCQRLLQSRFDDDTSTIVSKVPNKSVEDLYNPSLDPAINLQELSPFDEDNLERLGACGGAPVKPRPAIDPSRPSNELSGESFGVIKDLSVANIHLTDVDKTSEFLSKDLALICHKKGLILDKDKNKDSMLESDCADKCVTSESPFHTTISLTDYDAQSESNTDAVATTDQTSDDNCDISLVEMAQNLVELTSTMPQIGGRTFDTENSTIQSRLEDAQFITRIRVTPSSCSAGSQEVDGAVKQEVADTQEVDGAVEQEVPATLDVAGAVEQEVPAIQEIDGASEQEVLSIQDVDGAVEQEVLSTQEVDGAPLTITEEDLHEAQKTDESASVYV